MLSKREIPVRWRFAVRVALGTQDTQTFLQE